MSVETTACDHSLTEDPIDVANGEGCPCPYGVGTWTVNEFDIEAVPSADYFTPAEQCGIYAPVDTGEYLAASSTLGASSQTWSNKDYCDDVAQTSSTGNTGAIKSLGWFTMPGINQCSVADPFTSCYPARIKLRH